MFELKSVKKRAEDTGSSARVLRPCLTLLHSVSCSFISDLICQIFPSWSDTSRHIWCQQVTGQMIKLDLIFIFSLKMNIYAPVSHMVLLHFYNCIMKSLMLCIFVLDDVYRMISHASALFSSLQTSFIHYCNEKHCFCLSNMWLH